MSPGANVAAWVFNSSADRSWNNFPVHPLFMILLQQSATVLTSTADITKGTVGQKVVMSLPGRLMGDSATLQNPNGTTEPVKVTADEGATGVVVEPEMPGIFHIPAADSIFLLFKSL